MMKPPYSESVSAEKAYVQQLLDEFAKRHPKIASRLRHSADGSADPSVRRLVEAFSFLMARTRRRIDDEFPELLNPLLDLKNSTASIAIPSSTTVEFVIDPEQAPDADGAVVPRGTELESELVDTVPCRFQTCMDVALWPIELVSASLVFPPFSDLRQSAASATCALRLSLRTLAANISFDQLNADRLRFFIHSEFREALRIHQALFKDALDVAVRCSDGRPHWLGASALHDAGLDRTERLLPGAAAEGERLLSEFFCFPDKFLYFELHGLRSAFRNSAGSSIEIEIFFDTPEGALPRRILPRAILLNTSPVVNLFSRETMPVEVRELTDRVTLMADRRYPDDYRIHSLERVFIRDDDDVELELPRFNTLQHASHQPDAELMWEFDTLETSTAPSRSGAFDIRFVNAGCEPQKTGRCVVHAWATCSNGDLPQQLAIGEKPPVLQPESLTMVAECRCLSTPTGIRHFAIEHTDWNRVSEILPDCLTLDDDGGAAAMRAALRIFVCDDDPVLHALIESIVSVDMRRASGLVAGRMVCHGVDVQLTFRQTSQLQSGHLLFASVLRGFLAGYATQGTFFRMRAVYDSGEEIVQWPMTDGGRFVM